MVKIPNVCEIYVNGQEDLLKSLIAQYGPVSGAICKCKKVLAFVIRSKDFVCRYDGRFFKL